MPALTALAINLQQPQLMESPESIMFSLVPAYLFFKAMRMKSPKSRSTLRATKLSQQAVTRPAAFGQSIQVMKSKYSQAMKMKSSHVLSTTKVTQSLLVLRITLAEYGRTTMQ